MNGATVSEEIDLYEVLELERGASKAEIKKAYHKAALHSHPDKVAESERGEAEIKFKAVSQAYEILSDDEKRSLYDQYGMSAFEKGSGAGGPEMDINDILGSMFGMGGMGGMGGRGGMPRRPKKSEDEINEYKVTLEELYKGKSTKFTSTKKVICELCKGSGGKEGAKPKECSACKGQGIQQKLRQVGPGLVTPVMVECEICSGAGKFYKDKERCKKCKGTRTTEQKKVLELYIPPGSREGDKIILQGEADQHPDQEPGDLIFVVVQEEHETFNRAGSDLQAELQLELIEALRGFDRVVLRHLDGRGIQIKSKPGQILRPGQVLKIIDEGMPVKNSRLGSSGDLYLIVDVILPPDGYFDGSEKKGALEELLPKPKEPLDVEQIDEVEFEIIEDLEGFGGKSGDPRSGAQWEDMDDDEGAQQAECRTQ